MKRTTTPPISEANVVKIVVPLVPPSVNHYKMRTRKGVTFVSQEARSYKAAVAVCAQGRALLAKAYEVRIGIYLAAGQKGDIDNFAKLPLDALTACGVIQTDARVTRLAMEKHRDWENPRTEITVTAL